MAQYAVNNLKIVEVVGSPGVLGAYWGFNPRTSANKEIVAGCFVNIIDCTSAWGSKYVSSQIDQSTGERVYWPELPQKQPWLVESIAYPNGNKKCAYITKNKNALNNSPTNAHSNQSWYIPVENLEYASDSILLKLDSYEVVWSYSTGNRGIDGAPIYFEGSRENVKSMGSLYEPPSNATEVKVSVTPVPIAETNSEGNEVMPFEGKSTQFTFYKVNMQLPTLPAPTATIEGNTITANVELTNEILYAADIPEQMVQESRQLFDVVQFMLYEKKGLVASSYQSIVSYKINVNMIGDNTVTFNNIPDNGEYKVKCRAYRTANANFAAAEGLWSDFYPSGNEYLLTKPKAPKILRLEATSKNSVNVYFDKQEGEVGKEYEIMSATHEFKSYEQAGETITSGITTSPKNIIDLVQNEVNYFRIRCHVGGVYSDWSESKSIGIGEAPNPPTSWSSSVSSVISPVSLYWMHNAKDNSKEKQALLRLTIEGNTNNSFVEKVITNENTDDEIVPSVFIFDPSDPEYNGILNDGGKLTWSVKTCGAAQDANGGPLWSEFSIQRVVEFYSQPTITMMISTPNYMPVEDRLKEYPIQIEVNSYPATQKPVVYNVSIISNDPYETVNKLGEHTVVEEGEILFAKAYTGYDNLFYLPLTPKDVNLTNGNNYFFRCEVVMDSGLSAEVTELLYVDMEENEYFVNADVSIVKPNYSAEIVPSCLVTKAYLVEYNSALDRYTAKTSRVYDFENCEPVEGATVRVTYDGKARYRQVYRKSPESSEYLYMVSDYMNDITLSVYRKEYDGTFMLIADNVYNSGQQKVVDPHPNLKNAQYRIIATDSVSGGIAFDDTGVVKSNCSSIIIEFDGEIVELPYDVDVTESFSKDVSFVKYAGRSNPVAYHGTHNGEAINLSSTVDMNDSTTLDKLRRLSKWHGNVYIREPSGVGYWAVVDLSYPLTHCEVSIPVSITGTRVEGGI